MILYGFGKKTFLVNDAGCILPRCMFAIHFLLPASAFEVSHRFVFHINRTISRRPGLRHLFTSFSRAGFSQPVVIHPCAKNFADHRQFSAAYSTFSAHFHGFWRQLFPSDFCSITLLDGHVTDQDTRSKRFHINSLVVYYW